MDNKPCSCRGENGNCFKCFGTGMFSQADTPAVPSKIGTSQQQHQCSACNIVFRLGGGHRCRPKSKSTYMAPSNITSDAIDNPPAAIAMRCLACKVLINGRVDKHQCPLQKARDSKAEKSRKSKSTAVTPARLIPLAISRKARSKFNNKVSSAQAGSVTAVYVCDRCNFKAASAQGRTEHIRDMHQKSGSGPAVRRSLTVLPISEPASDDREPMKGRQAKDDRDAIQRMGRLVSRSRSIRFISGV
jgi:hypothetical protein